MGRLPGGKNRPGSLPPGRKPGEYSIGAQAQEALPGASDPVLMRLTGVSITTKRNMELRGVFVRNEDKTWNLEVCIPNYIEWLKKRHGGGSSDMGGSDITDPEQEFRKQKARQARMAADQMEGKLIDAVEVGHQWESHVFAAKAKFTAIPDKMVAELLPLLGEGIRMEDVRDPAKRMIDEALDELSKEQELDEYDEDGAEGSDGDEADD